MVNSLRVILYHQRKAPGSLRSKRFSAGSVEKVATRAKKEVDWKRFLRRIIKLFCERCNKSQKNSLEEGEGERRNACLRTVQ